MTDEGWARAKEMFLAALARPPGERRAWLEAACGADEHLASEVRRLLTAHDDAGSFIERPAAHVPEAALGADVVGVDSDLLEHYCLEALVGAGGMGKVYRAKDVDLGRMVAIKLLAADDPGGHHRLLREARHAARLNHPHICTIHDVGRHGGRPYIVMEFVEGHPLSELVPDGGLPATTAVRYAGQMADALAHAHAEGVVHRDLKSANVMITSSGDVKLLDFGLAQHQHADTDDSSYSLPTRTGALVAGTLSYMAPETLCGVAADARSDVWAFGVLLFEMMTGALPFTGRTAFELSGAILHAPPPEVPRTVPAAVAAIIRRCLRKSPGDRFSDARELRSALAAAQAQIDRQGRPGAGRRLLRAAGDAGDAVRPAIAVLLAVVVLVSVAGILRPSGPPRGPVATGVGGLAVLPFRNLSGDASQDYFADGLTEGLIGDLGRIGGLRVVSRTTAMHYRGTTKALPDVARELGVEALVEGSVVREGGRVRVTASLFRADDRQIWTESYERTLREILVLQRDMVRAVSTHIRATLALPEETRMSVVRSVDPEVYEAYLKGRYYWNKRTHESLLEAVKQYEFATQKDPTYAMAYVGLADCFNQLGTVMVGVASPRQMRPRARAAALAALQIDDGLGEAHAALAYVHHYDWEWTAAGREFDRAIELAPNYALAHLWRANYLASLNRLDEALVSVRRALHLDPMSPVVNTNVGWTLAFAGRHREAAEAYGAALALDPKYVQAHMRLSSAYLELGRADDALAGARRVVELMGENASSLGALATAYARTGRSREAEQVLQRLLAMQNRQFVSPWGLASLYFTLGRHDEGFAALEQAYEERSNGVAYLVVAHNGPHNDPRYRSLLQRVGLEAAAALPPATAAPAVPVTRPR